MKIITVVGTRPELIRLSIIIKKLDELVDHVLIFTSQNYDYNLSGKFFDELKIRKPDYIFEPAGSSFGSFLGNALMKFEDVLIKEMPDKILILGDTNSGLVSIIAERYKIPVYHCEAGNRCFDSRVPEETNRRLIDHLSKYNLPYTENSKQNLLSEGFHKNNVFKTGNPIYEVLKHHKYSIEGSDVLKRLNILPNSFVLVTAHRAENVDNVDSLSNIMRAINEISLKFKVVFSLHPRTKDKLIKLNIDVSDNIIFSEPLGFFDFVKLEQSAKLVISDCLHPHTIIVTQDGLIKKINDVAIHERIISNNSYEAVQAKDTKSITKKYKIITKYNEIKCSENHRLFVKQGDVVVEKKVKDILKSDRLLSLCKIETANNKEIKLKSVNFVDYIKIKEGGINELKQKSLGDALNQFGKFKCNTIRLKKGVSRDRLYTVLEYLNINKCEFNTYIYYDVLMSHKRQKKIKQPLTLNEEIAELVGFLCGDGFVTSGRISLFDQNENTLLHFNSVFEQCFGIKGKITKDTRNKCTILNVYAKTLYDFFIENFYAECQTTTTKTKDISDIITVSSDSVVAAYIRGLFEAEGFVGDHHFAITMSDKNIIYKLKL